MREGSVGSRFEAWVEGSAETLASDSTVGRSELGMSISSVCILSSASKFDCPPVKRDENSGWRSEEESVDVVEVAKD